MELTSLQIGILRLYVQHHRSGKREFLSSSEAAEQLNTTKDIMDVELEKLDAMGLLKLQRAFDREYTAFITAEGLVVPEAIAP